jgi:DNA-directed RNA polymerase subunit K/omega
MQTTYEIALNEFREASAIVRRAFGAVSEARELQIIADSQHKAASIALGEAQARMDAADKALTYAREAPKPAPTHTTAEVDDVTKAKPAPVFASFRDVDAPPVPNGAVIDAQADGIGIG